MGHLLGKHVTILDPDYNNAVGRVVRVGVICYDILEVEVVCPELGSITALMFESEVELVIDKST